MNVAPVAETSEEAISKGEPEVSTPGLKWLNGASQWEEKDGSDYSWERPPKKLKQRLGEGTATFSRTPRNASVGEKGAVEGMEL